MQTAEDRRDADTRLEARRILVDIARHIDRRLVVEVRDTPGSDRLQLSLKHGQQKNHVEVTKDAVLGAKDDAVARTDLRLRIKRAADHMLFRPMPNHRLSVKPVPAPGGQSAPRGRSTGRRLRT